MGEMVMMNVQCLDDEPSIEFVAEKAQRDRIRD